MLTIAGPTNVAETVQTETIEKTAALADRSLNVAGAKLRTDGMPAGLDECKFFLLSVALRGVHESLVKLRSCIEQDCDAGFLSKEQAKLLLRADRLDSTAEPCFVWIEK